MASLEVYPKPDIMIRLFVLFKGISSDDRGAWPQVTVDHTIWSSVIGVDTRRTGNKLLYRVLEWGGMEVETSLWPDGRQAIWK